MTGNRDTGECHWLQSYITPVPNFPKDGIVFQSYNKLLQDPQAFRKVIENLSIRYRKIKPNRIACLDARGFIFGAALAYELELPFFLIRKLGKLPCEVERIDYHLQYANATMEIDRNAVKKDEQILIIDDVLATGGTAQAAYQLIHKIGGKVIEFACIIELVAFSGRQLISPNVYSLLTM